MVVTDLDDTDAGQAPTSHTLAQTMGLDARHVQAMKASFFGSDEDEAEENEAPGNVPPISPVNESCDSVPRLKRPHDYSRVQT